MRERKGTISAPRQLSQKERVPQPARKRPRYVVLCSWCGDPPTREVFTLGLLVRCVTISLPLGEDRRRGGLCPRLMQGMEFAPDSGCSHKTVFRRQGLPVSQPSKGMPSLEKWRI